MLQKKHHKLGPDVRLQVYDQFSVPDEVDPKSSTQPETPAPTPLDVKDEPSVAPSWISRKMPHVMAHYVLNSNPPVTKPLDKFHVTVNIDIDDESEVGFIHILPSVGSEKVKNWNEECEATIDLLLKPLNSSSLPVQPPLLPKIQEIIEENTSLCIKFSKDNTILHIAGDSSEVAKLVREVKHIQRTKDQCPVCKGPIIDPVTTTCHHNYCRGCLARLLHDSPYCAVCNALLRDITGNQPDGGKMSHQILTMSLPGYEGYGTIKITYYIPGGVQGRNHPHPGRQFIGNTYYAYLPDSPEGKVVLTLLRKAFDAKLLFIVGKSALTRLDTVIWGDIEHKTALHGGRQR